MGSTMKVARCVAPSSSRTSKERLELVGGVGDYRIVDAGETRIRLEPRLMAVVAVSARPDDDCSLFEEVIVAFRKGRELGRADEREVARVEKQHHPTAAMT